MTRQAANDPEQGEKPRLSLQRAHRLKRRRLIRPLFDRDRDDVRSLPAGCVRAVYRFVTDAEHQDEPGLQVGVFVSRRTGNAVRRNRIRRQMREAYRRRHAELVRVLTGRSDLLTLALVFRGSPQIAWAAIQRDMNFLVDRLIKDLA